MNTTKAMKIIRIIKWLVSCKHFMHSITFCATKQLTMHAGNYLREGNQLPVLLFFLMYRINQAKLISASTFSLTGCDDPCDSILIKITFPSIILHLISATNLFPLSLYLTSSISSNLSFFIIERCSLRRWWWLQLISFITRKIKRRERMWYLYCTL